MPMTRYPRALTFWARSSATTASSSTIKMDGSGRVYLWLLKDNRHFAIECGLAHDLNSPIGFFSASQRYLRKPQSLPADFGNVGAHDVLSGAFFNDHGRGSSVETFRALVVRT